MAYITETRPVLSLSKLAARPFVAFWNVMVLIAEAHPKMNAVNALNAQTDAQLAARGTNRTNEIRRIFAGQFYL